MGTTIPKEGQGRQPARLRSRTANALVPLPAMRTPPEPPKSLTAVGKEAWRRAYASAPWLGSPADEQLVGIWARLSEERADSLKRISKSGRTATGSTGQLVTHPHVDQLRHVESEMLKFAAVIGLGSQNAARLGVSVQQLARNQETNVFRELVERRRSKPGVS
jgi:P27 family predicted phage terminase small subunit